MALGLPLDSPAVAELYKERETSWLAKELPYELVVPLLLTDLQIDDTFHIDADARFEKLSDEDLRAMFADYDLSGVPQPLALAAKHALVVKMPPLTNTDEPAMVFLPDPDTDPDLTKVRSVCEALRIVSSASVGWARMFRRPLGWTHRWKDALPVFSIQHTSREYPAAFDNYGWLKTGDAVATDELDKLPAVFAAMANASAKAKLAARRLSMADVRDDADDQLRIAQKRLNKAGAKGRIHPRQASRRTSRLMRRAAKGAQT
jgi:ribosomal protein S20